MTDIYAPARQVTRNFRYATEITDLVTAEGILIAMECPATARTVRKVIKILEALSLDHIALTQHWRPAGPGKCDRDGDILQFHYWTETADGVRCVRCGYGQIFTT